LGGEHLGVFRILSAWADDKAVGDWSQRFHVESYVR
jgi:hypothetical protein